MTSPTKPPPGGFCFAARSAGHVFVNTAAAVKPSQNVRHCERSEAIQNFVQRTVWIASLFVQR
ncbi:MAG: hypothetical protein LBG78_01110 [Azoarcus sp.]|nr:hypothetical protein [Azoarcus sp.]